MDKLRKTEEGPRQRSLKADTEEVRLPAKPQGTHRASEETGRWDVHLAPVPVGHRASRLPAAWLLVRYPQASVDPRIPSLGTDLLIAHKRCCWC